MKKLTSLLLVLSLCIGLTFLLASCGGGDGEDPVEFIETEYAGSTLYVYNWGEYISDGSEGTLDVIKRFRVSISGFRPIKEAIVTKGGVSVKEIDPKTMSSKLCSGLYFAGEIIDVDAYTGGYNLQIAFSTGVLAGRDAAMS